MKHKLGRHVKLLVLTLFSIAVSNCSPADQVITAPSGLGDYLTKNYYSIDPVTIVESLDRGETDVFSPVIATPEHYDRLSINPFPWEQSDFLRIADALHKHTWKESLDGWKVYNLWLYGDCQYEPLGFDLFQITYFKQIDSETYTAREIDVYPLYGGVATGGGTNFPKPLFGWKNLELQRFNITANDALRIAEQNGGMDARLSVENDCSISVGITANAPVWWISYSHFSNQVTGIFEITIDPYTGKHKVYKNQ